MDGDARVCCQASCVLEHKLPAGGSSCPLRTPFKRRGDLSGTHLPRCSQRSPAFLRGDSGGGVERGRGWREKTRILRSRPPPTSGAPLRLGVHTTAGQGARVGQRPGRARGSQYLPAPPGFAAPPPGHRPQTRAGRLRGGASGFKSGRRRALALERARHCVPDVERAGGTWEAGLPPRETETPARRSARGRRGWGGGAMRPRGVRGSELLLGCCPTGTV